jgi:hypothetical protein
MMTPYQNWAAKNPIEDAEGKAGVTRGGMQWFEDNGQYPRMFYKVGAPTTDAIGNLTNLIDGVAYSSIRANDADEAAVLVAEGWADKPTPVKTAKAA